CNGICMNGYISNFEVVNGYIAKINELFSKEEYLTKVREEIGENGWAFTEMKAYSTYKEECQIKSIPLNTIIDNETFDECLCQSDDMETVFNNTYINRIFEILKLNTLFRKR